MASRNKRSRGNGEGSIYQRESDGRWCCSITRSDGKRRVLYGKTRAEVARKLDAALQAREQGVPTPPRRLTVGKLLGEWLQRDIKQRQRTRTQESYEFLIRVHLKPALGRRRVVDLTVRDVEDFLRDKAHEDSKLGRPFVASTLRSLAGRSLGCAHVWPAARLGSSKRRSPRPDPYRRAAEEAHGYDP